MSNRKKERVARVYCIRIVVPIKRHIGGVEFFGNGWSQNTVNSRISPPGAYLFFGFLYGAYSTGLFFVYFI